MIRRTVLPFLSLLPVLLLTSACASPRRGPATRPMTVAIDTLALRAHTYFLAHDRLRGRGTGTAGARLAASYIASRCRALALQPVAGTYLHPLPLERWDPVPDSTVLSLSSPQGATVRFRLGTDFVLQGGTQSTLHGFRGRATWVGSGDEITGAPRALPPLEGAVALTAGTIRRAAAEVLRDRGAVGIVHLVADAATYDLYAASRGQTLMVIPDTTVPSSFFPPVPATLAGPDAARVFLRAARDEATVSLDLAFSRRPVEAENVTCLLPGRDDGARDTAIVYTAHYDHLGVSLPDAAGDSIYNGFSDNAAGVAMLLAIAQAIRGTPERALRHSVLFLFFSGEERGLLGSDYFVADSPFALARMRAVINLDAGAPPARPWAWRIAGGDGAPLGDLARDVAATRGWTATTSPATPNSDYYPFARRGVPAVFIIPGAAPYEGLSADSSQALRERWDRYHRASDEWHADFPFSGLRRYAEFALLLGRAIDRNPEVVRR